MKKFNQHYSLHDSNKPLFLQVLFKGEEGVTITLQNNKDGILAKHITKTDAILICISGEVIYEDKKNNKFTLKMGNFYRIEPILKHWAKGVKNSQLLLIK